MSCVRLAGVFIQLDIQNSAYVQQNTKDQKCSFWARCISGGVFLFGEITANVIIYSSADNVPYPCYILTLHVRLYTARMKHRCRLHGGILHGCTLLSSQCGFEVFCTLCHPYYNLYTLLYILHTFIHRHCTVLSTLYYIKTQRKGKYHDHQKRNSTDAQTKDIPVHNYYTLYSTQCNRYNGSTVLHHTSQNRAVESGLGL